MHQQSHNKKLHSSTATTTRPHKPSTTTTTMSSSLQQDGGLTCTICIETFTEEDRRPLMLPACGHTFCRQCMATLIARHAQEGTLLCPTCRRPQPAKAVMDLPVNYSLLEVARKEGLSLASFPSATTDSKPKIDISMPGKICSDHGSRLAFWCMSCDVEACGECLFDKHPRPHHELMRLQDYMDTLHERVRIQSYRLVSQLVSVNEENTAAVRAALIMLVEYLRQRRVLEKLEGRARTAREAANGAKEYSELACIRSTIAGIQREFEEGGITTTTRVCVTENAKQHQNTTTGKLQKEFEDVHLNQHQKSTNMAIQKFQEGGITATTRVCITENANQPQNTTIVDLLKEFEDVHLNQSQNSTNAPVQDLDFAVTTTSGVCITENLNQSPKTTKTSPSVPFKTPLTRQINLTDLPQPQVSTIRSPSTTKPEKPSLLTPSTPPPASTTPLTSSPSLPAIPASTPPSKNGPSSQSPLAGEPTSWCPLLCGVMSSNWTSSRINLEPRGLHVYALRSMKEKCDLFVNMDVVSSLVPLQSPEVFLDLHDGRAPLGRVYISLQSHLYRAQQFLSLCIGEKGPSYRNSLFHSVLRKGGIGEGLVGGDYNGKAGKGGAAILRGVQGEAEMAKRCERGMVVRAKTSAEMAAQFCIMVRDGGRSRTVFPFGRVTKGLNAVEEACRRPAMTVGVKECGWVLPV